MSPDPIAFASSRPVGPPPPLLPEGWVQVWDEEYQRAFFVNCATAAAQWEDPTMAKEDETSEKQPHRLSGDRDQDERRHCLEQDQDEYRGQDWYEPTDNEIDEVDRII
ncbi:hypothetical protein BJX66DRAFT_335016 [Aspergillus keveii]|uniref:WW domain-containing protein n=1 Tax=Aspergillus keveii TaxID=714993 RepID=A0ABR4GFK0_9EURO